MSRGAVIRLIFLQNFESLQKSSKADRKFVNGNEALQLKELRHSANNFRLGTDSRTFETLFCWEMSTEQSSFKGEISAI